MKQNNRWLVLVMLLTAVLWLTACGGEEGPTKIEPAQLEPVAGTDFNRVTLTERAAQRLGIESEPVATMTGGSQLTIPYAALLYGLNGETWVYVRNPGADSLTFVREVVVVDHIDGDTAVLTDGPAIGTEVVTVGVAELFGTDTGVGK